MSALTCSECHGRIIEIVSDLRTMDDGVPARYFVFMGVSGAGKSTVAEAVAAAIAGTFIEADALHPPTNVKAMAAGQPLTDADRWPWLAAVCEAARTSAPDRPVTIACSALARRYREFIRRRLRGAIFIHLRGPAEVIRARMARRKTHFMPAALLESQIAALEETADEGDCHGLDIDDTAAAIIAEATAICRRHAAGREVAPRAPIESEAKKTCTKGGQTMLRTAAKLSIAAVAVTLFAGTALAQNYTFKFQSSDPAGNPNFVLQQEWAKNVGEMTGGQITINLLPVDSIVGHAETQDAIAAGILDGHITDVSYFSGKDPAFGLIANPVGAWSDPHTMLDFMRNGGGGKLMQELDGEYGLHFIGATTPGLEALVSKVPLDSVADLKGLKIRAPEGLVRQRLRRSRCRAGQPARFGSLHRARQGRHRRRRLHGLLDQPGAGSQRHRAEPGLSRLPLAAAGRDRDQQQGLGHAVARPAGQADPVGPAVRRP